MEMPFGKYRGCYIGDIETGYLQWLWHNAELYGELRDAVYRELKNREARAEFFESCGASGASGAGIDARQVQRIFRTLAFKWHPDRGGSTSAQQALNEFYERLKQI